MQKVIRTFPPESSYISDYNSIKALDSALSSGWHVVMVNPITRGGNMWLEYIVEKEDKA